MAQSPMESTTRDFWKMIVERECRAVVMLCGLEEDGNVCYKCKLIAVLIKCLSQEVCHQYWPDASEVEKYNEHYVECKNEDKCSDYIERVLVITDKVS